MELLKIIDMKKIRCRLLLLVLFLISCFSKAQNNILPDMVSASKAYIDTIIKNYTDEDTMSFSPTSLTSTVRIPVVVHIIIDNTGQAGVSTSDISTSIGTANSFFKNIGILFYIDQTDYINDYNYAFIRYGNNLKELLSVYPVKNRINLFLADSILMGTKRSYGYTCFPDAPDSNYIFLDKKYISGYYLTTMLGHYFGLLSTHDTVGGAELASEENCDEAGDFICDTYADPDLYNQVDTTCNYQGAFRDAHGDFFVPTVANIMSNSPDECKCDFTPLQYKRMYYYYLKYRQYP